MWGRILTVGLVALFVSACGDVTTGTGQGAIADGAIGLNQGDLTGMGDGDPLLDATVTDQSAPDESASDIAAQCPNSAGCACEQNVDCFNGMCIDTPTGKQCAVPCVDACPVDFKCSVVALGSDTVTICVPKWGNLCNPCMESKECGALGQNGAACIDEDAKGAFCGIACKENLDCPPEYSCQSAKSMEGAGVKQCVRNADPDSTGAGTCPCSPAAVAQQLSTKCVAVGKDETGNILGTCKGKRTCTPTGLGPCQAPTAAPEVCDGEDNDCNGKTDDNSCDDGTPCTTDSCDGKAGCAHTPSDGPCDADGSVCTQNDTCSAGKCVAGPGKKCDDGNPCTMDKCDPLQGCSQEFDDGAPCEDDNPCTIGDLCQTGQCLHGVTKECNSTDACLSAKCDQNDGKCLYTPNQDGLPCDDGTLCTSADACATGACTGKVIVCDDGLPCTMDGCDLALGCTATDVAGACDDGNGCTQGDACKAGACAAGAAMGCDDTDACTLDACSPATGLCSNDAVAGCGGNCALSADCNDGNPCTDDTCKDGKCQVAANTAACEDNEICTEKDICTGGLCAGTAIGCDDSNPCTTDGCTPGKGCFHGLNSLACDDGNACTIGDVCAGYACKSGAATTCDDGNPCTTDSCEPASGTCKAGANTAPCSDNNACTSGDQCAAGACKPGSAMTCNDGKVCTTDKCDPATGSCVVTNNTLACTDSNACTSGDICSGGACKAGAAKSCNDNNACTTDSCTASTGACVNKPIVGCGGNCVSVTDCDDKNPCTADACTAGKCANNVTTDACSDGNGCTLGDVCAGGECKPGAAKPCNDSNACTDDTCDTVTGACKAANNTVPCSDNDACTTGDACAAGVCAPGKAVDCNDKDPCTVGETCKLGACVVGTPVVCNDKKPCTDDSCDKATGLCAFVNNTAACSDANACTVGDICAAGVCKAGAAITCNDNNACTADACDVATGKCSNTANALACTDNNACTVGDVCSGGACKLGALTVCDDKNACTSDKCDTVSGKCVFTNIFGACSDGNACTPNDKCDGAGKCVSGIGVLCKGTMCSDALCNTVTGVCDPTPKANTTTCDDGQLCTAGDKCDGAGKCVGGPWDITCGCQTDGACDDKNPCTTDKCVSTKCTFTITSGAACDDADPCSTTSICDAGGKCLAKTLVDCSIVTDQCNKGACYNNAGSAACTKVPVAVGTACSDGLFCTTTDTCDLKGKCSAGPAPQCGKPAKCFSAVCTEAAKGCTFQMLATGTPCDDGGVCTSGDTCTAGKCSGPLVKACTPVLADFTPATPSTSTGTAVNGSATNATTVFVYPTADCTGVAVNASGTVASPGFTTAFTAASQACTKVSAQAKDTAGNLSTCSNSLTFANYNCTQCSCPASDWIRQFGTTKADSGSNAAVDTAGNYYVVGTTDGAWPDGVNAGLTDAWLAKLDSTGKRLWLKQIGTAQAETGVTVALDAAGFIWIGGTTAGDIDGAGPGTLPPAGDTDVFVAKYDNTGKQLLIKSWGTTTRYEALSDMAYDAVGARLVILVVSSAPPSASAVSPVVLTVSTSTAAIAKLWEFMADTQNKNPTGLTVASDGTIFVQGRTQFALAGGLTTTGAENGGLYVYKLSSTGTVQWLQHWGSPGFDYGGDLVTDGLGTVYATGFAQGLAYGTPAGTKYMGSNGLEWGYGGDVVVAAFDAKTGVAKWVSQVGSAGGESGYGIDYVPAKGGGGNLFVSGYTTGNFENATNVSKFGGRDSFVLKMTTLGAVTYLHQIGTKGDDGTGRISHAGSSLLIPGTSAADWTGQSVDACTFMGGTDAFLGRFCTQ